MNSRPVRAITRPPAEIVALTGHGLSVAWQAARIPPTPLELTKSIDPTTDNDPEAERLRRGPPPVVEKATSPSEVVTCTPELSRTLTPTCRRCVFERANRLRPAPVRRKKRSPAPF